jgi:hypothetical protein
MPVGVRLRSANRAVSMAKKGKAPATDYPDYNTALPLRQSMRGLNQTLNKGEGKGKSKRKEKEDKAHTDSKAFDFDDTVLETAKRKHTRQYGPRGKHPGKKEKTNFANEEFSKRDKIHSRKQISKRMVEISEEEDERKENQGHVPEPKIQRSSSRVLEKTGKKVRVNRKELGTGSVEKGNQVKRRRVIKIDPYDQSNKRLDDTPLLEGDHLFYFF